MPMNTLWLNLGQQWGGVYLNFQTGARPDTKRATAPNSERVAADAECCFRVLRDQDR
jgi:hypothetical protein